MSARSRRLGRVETAILDALSRSGSLTPREEILVSAFPSLDAGGGAGARSPDDGRTRRARAEAALSRAILSLERKGLIARERNRRTGRTFLRSAGDDSVPTWEQLARAEEDLAAHCGQVSRRWADLGRRARHRAETIRAERSEVSTEEGRSVDLEALARLEPPSP